MRLFKIPTLTPFLISQKNIRKSLLIINIGIFLSIFAASSAIISLYIENKISKYETEIIESRYLNNFFTQFEQLISSYEDSRSRFLSLNETFVTYNEILMRLKNSESLIDDREYYFYRLLSAYRQAKEGFGDEEFHEISMFFEKEFLETLYDPIVHKKFLDELKSKNIKFKKYIQEYNLIKDDLKNLDPFKLIDDDELLNSFLDDDKNIERNFVKLYEMNYFMDEYISALKIVMSDWSISEKSYNLENFQEVERLSNLEKQIIIIAFILQIIIFFVTQFFEITFASKVKKNIKQNRKI
jgi:hypothetical protein